MPLNEIARQRLAGLSRDGSKGRLPMAKLIIRRCPECDFPNRGNSLKYCQRCRKNEKRQVELPAKTRPRCRLCDEEVPKGRQSWCGEECLDAYYMVTSGSYVRAKVFERDGGVCANEDCRLDCNALEKRLNALQWKREPGSYEAYKQACAMIREHGFDYGPGYYGRVTLWDADHITPLAEGGSWELSNLQTLCQPCHKEKTAEQAGRKAKQKRMLGRKHRDTQKMLVQLGMK